MIPSRMQQRHRKNTGQSSKIIRGQPKTLQPQRETRIDDMYHTGYSDQKTCIQRGASCFFLIVTFLHECTIVSHHGTKIRFPNLFSLRSQVWDKARAIVHCAWPKIVFSFVYVPHAVISVESFIFASGI